MQTRIDFTHFPQDHSGKVEFPYTSSQLARALLLLCDHPELSEKMEEFDNPKEPAKEKEVWYKETAIR